MQIVAVQPCGGHRAVRADAPPQHQQQRAQPGEVQLHTGGEPDLDVLGRPWRQLATMPWLSAVTSRDCSGDRLTDSTGATTLTPAPLVAPRVALLIAPLRLLPPVDALERSAAL